MSTIDDDLIALQCTYCPDCGGGCRVDPEAADEAIRTANDWARRSPLGRTDRVPGRAGCVPTPRHPVGSTKDDAGTVGSGGAGDVGGLVTYRADDADTAAPGGDVDGKRW